jgi:hypothetical protein
MKSWWWLSFADDDGFRGVAIVQAGDVIEGVTEAWRLEINPGGGVLSVQIPDERLSLYPVEMRNVLLNREQAEMLADKE